MRPSPPARERARTVSETCASAPQSWIVYWGLWLFTRLIGIVAALPEESNETWCL